MKLILPSGTKTNRKRLGRGQGSGTGCTAGKGTKGQKARAGKKLKLGFEGGQMPLYRRLPQRGFSNYLFKQVAEEITLKDLDRHFKANEIITVQKLQEKKLVSLNAKFVKILKTGEITKSINIDFGIYSTKAAKEAIETKGGKLQEQIITNKSKTSKEEGIK